MLVTLFLLLDSLVILNVNALSDSNYQFVTKWENSDPYFIDVDSLGNVYVAGRNSNKVDKYDSNGTLLLSWGGPGSEDGKFNDPEGIAVDSAGGFVYVSDNRNNRIQKFNLEGEFLAKWGSTGSGDGEFRRPAGVAVDSSGNVYVTDRENDRVEKFDPSGRFLIKWGGEGAANGMFNSPESIAVDSLGNVYVGDEENNRVQKFDSQGTFISIFVRTGSGEGQTRDPEDVAVDKFDNVYIADSDNNRIERFDSKGVLTDVWGGGGSVNGKFADPRGVAIDDKGNVYIADTGNARVQKFTPSTGILIVSCTDSRGQPLSAADIISTSQPMVQAQLLGSTDDNGFAEFRGVMPGSYTLETRMNGTVVGTQSSEVIAGQETITIITAVRLGDLLVKVVDSNNAPIYYVEVTMTQKPAEQQAETVYTNGEGEVRLNDLYPGEYKIKATGDGLSAVEPVFVIEGEEVSILIKLMPVDQTTGSLRIFVKNETGDPLLHANVKISSISGAQVSMEATTGTNGVAEGVGMAPGKYSIEVLKVEYITITQSIDVEAGRTAEITITLIKQVLDHFEFDEVQSPLLINTPVIIKIKAIDQAGNIYTPYNSRNTLTSTIGSIDLRDTGNFVEGIWSGAITYSVEATSVKLITTGENKSGESNVFWVRSPPVLDRFLFISIPSGYIVNTPFEIRVLAIDQYGEIFTNYTGSNTLTASISSVRITPNTIGPFIEGISDARITFLDPARSVSLITTNAEGLTGESNGFLISDVSTQPLHCIIATATYGGQFAPEVIYMRYVRDDLIGSNEVGRILVKGWNIFYYSWSPPIAHAISGSSRLRSIFSAILIPLLGMMHLIAFEYEVIAQISLELASLISFVTAAIIATSIYIILPILALIKLRDRHKRHAHPRRELSHKIIH